MRSGSKNLWHTCSHEWTFGSTEKLTVRSARNVTRLVDQIPRKSAADLAKVVFTLKLVVLDISAVSVRRTLHQANLRGRRARRKPLLKHKKKKPVYNLQAITKINLYLFGIQSCDHSMWRRTGKEYKEMCLVPTSQTWERKSDGLGLHEFTWCRRASRYHHYRHVLQNFEYKDDTIS